MIISMPVEAYSESCITCPELDIDIITKEFIDLEMPEEGRTSVKKATYTNTLRCKHCERCKVIFNQAQQKEKKSSRATKSKSSSTTKTAKAKTTKKSVETK